jgi:antirestriction protein ArdC
MKNTKKYNNNTKENNQINYYEILDFAFNQAGIISKAYNVFHRYSARNALIAIAQANKLNRQVSPINTFKGWEKLGRKVKKGEKAIALFLPIIVKDKNDCKEDTEKEDNKENKSKAFFVLKRNWFLYSQTDGEEEINFDEQEAYKHISNTEFKDNFDLNLVLKNLEIKEEEFKEINGNVQGYAKREERTIAINPLAENRFNTMLHEIAHIILHTQSKSLKHEVEEVEAETTAYLILSILGINKGQEESRGYIQGYLKNLAEAEKQQVGKRIILTACNILDAGKGESIQLTLL